MLYKICIFILFAAPASAADLTEAIEELMNLAQDNKTLEEARELVEAIESGLKVYTEIPEQTQREPVEQKLFIFISASVPMNTLRAYAADASENTIFVLRGTVGPDPAKILPTYDFISRLLCGKPMQELSAQTECRQANIEMDPELFRHFEIKEVPAFVMENNGNYAKLSGAVSLKYAIDKLSGALERLK